MARRLPNLGNDAEEAVRNIETKSTQTLQETKNFVSEAKATLSVIRGVVQDLVKNISSIFSGFKSVISTEKSQKKLNEEENQKKLEMRKVNAFETLVDYFRQFLNKTENKEEEKKKGFFSGIFDSLFSFFKFGGLFSFLKNGGITSAITGLIGGGGKGLIGLLGFLIRTPIAKLGAIGVGFLAVKELFEYLSDENTINNLEKNIASFIDAFKNLFSFENLTRILRGEDPILQTKPEPPPVPDLPPLSLEEQQKFRQIDESKKLFFHPELIRKTPIIEKPQLKKQQKNLQSGSLTEVLLSEPPFLGSSEAKLEREYQEKRPSILDRLNESIDNMMIFLNKPLLSKQEGVELDQKIEQITSFSDNVKGASNQAMSFGEQTDDSKNALENFADSLKENAKILKERFMSLISPLDNTTKNFSELNDNLNFKVPMNQDFLDNFKMLDTYGLYYGRNAENLVDQERRGKEREQGMMGENELLRLTNELIKVKENDVGKGAKRDESGRIIKFDTYVDDTDENRTLAYGFQKEIPANAEEMKRMMAGEMNIKTKQVEAGDSMTPEQAEKWVAYLTRKILKEIRQDEDRSNMFDQLPAPAQSAIIQSDYQMGKDKFTGEFKDLHEALYNFVETGDKKYLQKAADNYTMNFDDEGKLEGPSLFSTQTNSRAEYLRELFTSTIPKLLKQAEEAEKRNQQIINSPNAAGFIAKEPSVIMTGEYSGAGENPEVTIQMNALENRVLAITGHLMKLRQQENEKDSNLVMSSVENRIRKTMENSKMSEERVRQKEAVEKQMLQVQMPVMNSVVDNKTVNNTSNPILVSLSSRNEFNRFRTA